jgi:hypothetical protein
MRPPWINGLVKFCNHLHHGLLAIMLIQVPAAGPQDDYSPMFEAHHTPMPVSRQWRRPVA